MLCQIVQVSIKNTSDVLLLFYAALFNIFKYLEVCGDPPEVDNAYETHTGVEYGSTATYQCNTGYAMKGNDDTITCEASGRWSKNTPSCKKQKGKHMRMYVREYLSICVNMFIRMYNHKTKIIDKNQLTMINKNMIK